MKTEPNFDFTFNQSACEQCSGLCCIGESAYAWITLGEIDRLADHLHLTQDELYAKYLTKVNSEVTLNEVQLEDGQFACVFFDLEKRNCAIYEVRPEQCRIFPFWPEYEIFKDEAFYLCPGIREK